MARRVLSPPAHRHRPPLQQRAPLRSSLAMWVLVGHAWLTAKRKLRRRPFRSLQRLAQTQQPSCRSLHRGLRPLKGGADNS